jgi:hypothetical protein
VRLKANKPRNPNAPPEPEQLGLIPPQEIILRPKENRRRSRVPFPVTQRELRADEVKVCYLPPPASPVVFARPESVPVLRCGEPNALVTRDLRRVTCPQCRHLEGLPKLPIPCPMAVR